MFKERPNKRKHWLLLGFLALVLTGCPLPIPRTATIQPKLTIQLLDDKGKPLSNQIVWFSWLSHPHRRLHKVMRLKSNAEGKIYLSRKTKREWIMPLMMHGIPQHFWVVCLEKKGYQTISKPYYLGKPHAVLSTLTLRLKPGTSRNKCQYAKRAASKH